MGEASLAVFVLREITAASAIGCRRGMMRQRLWHMLCMMAAGRMGQSRLPHGDKENEDHRQHQPQDPQCRMPAMARHRGARHPARAERRGDGRSLLKRADRMHVPLK